MEPLLMQLIALSLYLLCMGFCFCDGFKMHTGRKLIWFGVFAAISIYTFNATHEFNLALILPVPSLLAILLGSFERRKAILKEAQQITARQKEREKKAS
jgi:hypothetical protein